MPLPEQHTDGIILNGESNPVDVRVNLYQRNITMSTKLELIKKLVSKLGEFVVFLAKMQRMNGFTSKSEISGRRLMQIITKERKINTARDTALELSLCQMETFLWASGSLTM